MENGNGNNNIPEIELIIKASTIDGRRKGACIFCQEYFMDLYLLAELKTISLKITTVDMKRPPPDFRSNFEAAQPPILVRSTNDFFLLNIFSGSLKGDCNISRHKKYVEMFVAKSKKNPTKFHHYYPTVLKDFFLFGALDLNYLHI